MSVFGYEFFFISIKYNLSGIGSFSPLVRKSVSRRNEDPFHHLELVERASTLIPLVRKSAGLSLPEQWNHGLGSRVGLRTSFTKTANILKAELVNVGFSVDLVRDKFTKLQSVYLDIKVLDEKILDLLSEDGKALESDIANEIENREVYSDDFITLSRQVSERLRISDEIDVRIKSNRGSSVSRDGIKQ
ncbi:DUF1758 domain-containing protein [Trichonephila clavata]|uniref:DUF1758 domain-containing protein n=1 Tax=Trichonephila clavata TaxID=2740835 RepID=A0A8X6HUB1_TRICU|nr:DUF1758 domain-containing protein [Trichonephila clavata]